MGADCDSADGGGKVPAAPPQARPAQARAPRAEKTGRMLLMQVPSLPPAKRWENAVRPRTRKSTGSIAILTPLGNPGSPQRPAAGYRPKGTEWRSGSPSARARLRRSERRLHRQRDFHPATVPASGRGTLPAPLAPPGRLPIRRSIRRWRGTALLPPDPGFHSSPPAPDDSPAPNRTNRSYSLTSACRALRLAAPQFHPVSSGLR